MKARYQYRIYPRPTQIEPLAKAFGCSRVVWNDALWIYKNAFRNGEGRPKDVDKLVITQAKKTESRTWLSEVSNIVLQQSFRDLQQAWNNYFSSVNGLRKGKPVGKPKLKKKTSRQSMRFRKGGFSVHSCSVKLAKIGHVPMIVSRPLPSEPSSVTIIKDTTGRYFASFVVEIPEEIAPQAARFVYEDSHTKAAATNNSSGIDLGLTHFAILNNGEKIENPRLHKKMLRKIKLANRRLAKAKKDSNRRRKRKLRLAKLHAKVKDARTDFLHKLTTRLVRENQALAVEDLNVSGMVKNRKLSRAISDAGWSKFKTMLEAKCDKYCRDLTIVDRWYPSSQICSCCGKSGGKKELDVREWECLFCNTIHDRDLNASINLNRWAGGQSDQDGAYKLRGKPTQTAPHKYGRGASVSQAKLAVCGEASTNPVQLTLF
jgi:putative transposase